MSSKSCRTSQFMIQYPLIFWQGTDGYHFLLRQTHLNTGLNTNKKISVMDFYEYRIMIKSNSYKYLLRFKQLLNQFLVDMHAKSELERLLFIKINQKKLQAEEYIGCNSELWQCCQCRRHSYSLFIIHRWTKVHA